MVSGVSYGHGLGGGDDSSSDRGLSNDSNDGDANQANEALSGKVGCPLIVVGVPDLPKHAAVEVELMATPSSIAAILPPVRWVTRTHILRQPSLPALALLSDLECPSPILNPTVT